MNRLSGILSSRSRTGRPGGSRSNLGRLGPGTRMGRPGRRDGAKTRRSSMACCFTRQHLVFLGCGQRRFRKNGGPCRHATSTGGTGTFPNRHGQRETCVKTTEERETCVGQSIEGVETDTNGNTREDLWFVDDSIFFFCFRLERLHVGHGSPHQALKKQSSNRTS